MGNKKKTVNVKKILKQHNLSYYNFARLTRASVRAIHKFENGEAVRPDCKKRIKRGLYILMNCRVVWPDPKEAHVNFGYSYGSAGGDTYWDRVERCNARYRKLLDYYNEKVDSRNTAHGVAIGGQEKVDSRNGLAHSGDSCVSGDDA